MVDPSRVVGLVTVISYYPGRGEDGTDEALCDAGGITMSNDPGPIKGYCRVRRGEWYLKSIPQVQGILAQGPGGSNSGSIKIGDKVEIIGQHACMIAAGHPRYYVVDSSAGGCSKGGGRVGPTQGVATAVSVLGGNNASVRKCSWPVSGNFQ